MRSLIIIYGRNCPRFLGLRRRVDWSEADCSAPKSGEVCEGLHVRWSCRRDLVWVRIPDPVWRIGAPLVSCLYFSTLASLHFDHCHELYLGSITSSSQQIQASVLLFISAKPVFLFFFQFELRKHLHVSSDYCFYIVSGTTWVTLYPRVESGGCFTCSSTGLSPFRQRLLLLIGS